MKASPKYRSFYRVPRVAPTHEFGPSDLPAFPGLKQERPVVACRHCGLIGAVTPDGAFVDVFAASPHRVRNCTHHGPEEHRWHARITDAAPYVAAPDTGHLKVGSTHLLVAPPTDDPEDMARLWVRGPEGPVPLAPGTFTLRRVRARKRSRAAIPH